MPLIKITQLKIKEEKLSETRNSSLQRLNLGKASSNTVVAFDVCIDPALLTKKLLAYSGMP